MITWIKSFDTQIDTVDEQHKRLFGLLKTLSNGYEDQEITMELVSRAIGQLREYAHRHFVDEELLMVQYRVDERHIRLHRMEHHSFMYDTEKMAAALSKEKELDATMIKALVERLISFITSWLTCHILGMDQMMARQMRDIENGCAPEIAYKDNPDMEYDMVTTRLLLSSVLSLWHIATERAHQLERQVNELRDQVEVLSEGPTSPLGLNPLLAAGASPADTFNGGAKVRPH